MSFLSSLFGAAPVVQTSSIAVQAGKDYVKAMLSKDIQAITDLFAAKAHIENNNVESVLLPDECFQGGKSWAELATKFTVSNAMVGSGNDSTEACVVMIMNDPTNPSKAVWSMHILKVEQIGAKYQIVGMKVVETTSYGQ